MAVFNSLGSNYTFGFVLNALFAQNKDSNRLRLINYLERKYEGKVLLTYKGREALRLALRIIGLPNKYTVGICGFTCYAVYNAVASEGYRIRYLDISEDDLNFSFEKFVEGLHKHPSMKVLVIQNTLGFPCEIEKIAKFCRDRGIILIEDLAHSIGSRYTEKEAGTVGDFAVLSFSQDKMVDGITGGAVVIRNSEFRIPSNLAGRQNSEFNKVSANQQWKDRFYPLLTFLIRKTYGWGLGKALHVLAKKFNLLSKPMTWLHKDKIFELPNWYCYLIYKQFIGLERDLVHRRKIASIYTESLSKSILSSVLNAKVSKGSNLRFPIFVSNREELIAYLKRSDIFISDIWYDSPIAPKSYLQLTDYKHDCPNSEKVSSMMVNLPTHRGVSEKEARYIVEMVNTWLST